MKYIIAACAALLCGCAHGGPGDNVDWSALPDAGDAEAGPTLELVCAQDFCGTIVDKNTGATANCGSCTGYSECGDNGIANVCGSSCMPMVASDGDGGVYTVTPACNYAFGPAWWAGYAAAGEQFPPSCNYMDPNACVLITNPWPTNDEPCSGTVCGNWYCCLDDPDAGWNPLLPGAVANNDGGLP
jgi:hypothetical protein